MKLFDGQEPTIWSKLWRRFRLAVLLSDLKREHKALVRSFDLKPRADATLAVCTCLPGEQASWGSHGPACRTWLS